jgi:hypothetical protein
MIRVSFVVLFLSLQYHEMNLASGAQTIRLGWAGPVSYLHGRATLTGCFFCLLPSVIRHPSSVNTPSFPKLNVFLAFSIRLFVLISRSPSFAALLQGH